MNNKDFARLLTTNDKALVESLTKAPKKKARPPREFHKGKGKGEKATKGRIVGGGDSDDDDRPQKGKGAGKAGLKAGGGAGQKKKEPEYRDRAKDRREGKEEYAQVAAEFEQHEEIQIDESKYLGGDMDHTHLVKGLDYALLTKVRTEINKQKKHDDVHEMRMQKKLGKKQTFRNLLAGKVWRSVVETLHPHHSTFSKRMDTMRKALASGQKIRGAPSVFLPGRMAFEFETGMEQGRNDIPRILYMSKEDAPPVDLSKKVASILPETVTRVRDAMQKAIEERKQRKLNKSSGAEASYAVAQKISVKHKAKDSDNDIFGGVAAYDINEIVKSAEAQKRSASKASNRSSKDKENEKGNKRSSYFDDAGAEKYRKEIEGQLDPADMIVEENPGEGDADGEATSAEAVQAFEKADRFEGPRKGWAFKLGSQGLGYYKDPNAGKSSSAAASSGSTAGERRNSLRTAARKARAEAPADDDNAYDECFPDSGLGGAMMSTMDGDSDEEDGNKKKKLKADDKDKANDTMESSAYGKKSGGPMEGKKKKVSEAQEWQKINHMIKNNKHKSVGELEALGNSRKKKDPPMPRELNATPAFF